ncbi:MAG: ATP-binding cassette domain-containing protein, partial [Brachybacterium sp.]|nr:ATP-binding cassette domain-containing protein [Brachybacterium sp.]
LDLVDLRSKRRTRFENLSGGQMQRLAVGIALIGRPKVVILDELTTGLDPGARRRVWRAIENLREETILLVSHAMDEVERLCDRIVLLDAGRVRAEGTAEELRRLAGAADLEEAFVALTGRTLMDSDEEDDR